MTPNQKDILWVNARDLAELTNDMDPENPTRKLIWGNMLNVIEILGKQILTIEEKGSK
jgi:hypothetical protein